MEYNGNWQIEQEHMVRAQHGIVFGIALSALGALFLFDNLAIAQFHEVARYWPVIVIALGVVRLVDTQAMPSKIFGGILAAAGGLVLLHNLNIIDFGWREIWPALVAGAGILVWSRAEHWRQSRAGARHLDAAFAGKTPPLADFSSNRATSRC